MSSETCMHVLEIDSAGCYTSTINRCGKPATHATSYRKPLCEEHARRPEYGMATNEVIDLGGPGSRYWIITKHGGTTSREQMLKLAQSAAIHARVTGSIGSTFTESVDGRPDAFVRVERVTITVV